MTRAGEMMMRLRERCNEVARLYEDIVNKSEANCQDETSEPLPPLSQAHTTGLTVLCVSRCSTVHARGRVARLVCILVQMPRSRPRSSPTTRRLFTGTTCTSAAAAASAATTAAPSELAAPAAPRRTVPAVARLPSTRATATFRRRRRLHHRLPLNRRPSPPHRHHRPRHRRRSHQHHFRHHLPRPLRRPSPPSRPR